MISRQTAVAIAKKQFPPLPVISAEPFYTNNYTYVSEGIADNDADFLYIGKLTYWSKVKFFRYRYNAGMDNNELYPLVVSETEFQVSSHDVVLTSIDPADGFNLGFEFVGWKITLGPLQQVTGTVRVASTTDRNITDLTIVDSFQVIEHFAHVSGQDLPMSHGQSGEYVIRPGKFVVGVKCEAGIKAAHARITTSQGVFDSDALVNGGYVSIYSVAFNGAAFTIEIIDDTL